MGDEFDPYLRWLGIRTDERPPNHYALLGVQLFEYDPEVLANAADRQMAHVRTFQTGKHSAESQRLLNELATAKICLLDPDRKAAYDAELQSRSEGAELAAVTDGSAFSAAGRSKRSSAAGTVIVVFVAAAILALGVMAVAISRSQFSADDSSPERSRWKHLPPRRTSPHRPPRRRTDVPRHNPRTVGKHVEWPPEPSSSQPSAPRVVPEPPVEPVVPKPEPEPTDTEPVEEPPQSPEPPPVEVEPTPKPAKASLPSVAALAAARRKIRQKHASRYRSIKKPSELRSLASALLREVSGSDDDAMRYVYFEEAATAATVGGGRASMLRTIVSRASRELQIPEDQILLAFLRHIAAEPIPLACRQATLDAMAETAVRQANRENFDVSKEVLELTLGVARRTKDAMATKQVSFMKKRLETWKEACEAARQAKETLKQTRADPEAHRICGVYDCFYRNSWGSGRKHLMKGDKPRLRKLAELDQQASRSRQSGKTSVEAGDAWRTAVSSAEPALRHAYRQRALYWYRRSLDHLSGLEKQKIENRIRVLQNRLK